MITNKLTINDLVVNENGDVYSVSGFSPSSYEIKHGGITLNIPFDKPEFFELREPFRKIIDKKDKEINRLSSIVDEYRHGRDDKLELIDGEAFLSAVRYAILTKSELSNLPDDISLMWFVPLIGGRKNGVRIYGVKLTESQYEKILNYINHK